MAQSAEGVGVGIVKGEGADARHGVPDPGPQLVSPVRRTLHCVGGHLHLLLPPDGADAHGLTFQILKNGLNFLHRIHLGAVDVGNDISFLKAAVTGRGLAARIGGDLGEPYHHHAVRKELDAHRPAQRYHRLHR